MTGVKTELVRNHATKETFTPTADIPRSTVQSAIEYIRSLIAGFAPNTADYLVKTADSGLSAERVVTDTPTVAWDWATAGQAKANIPDNAITYAKLQQEAAVRVVGNPTSGTANLQAIAAGSDDTLLRRVASALSFGQLTAGMFPANVVADAALRQSGGTSVVGRADTAAGNVADIVANSDDTLLRRVGATLSWGALTIGMFGANLVTYAKIQQVSATSRILGRRTAAAGDIEECTLSQILDFVGSAANGDILYRTGGVWSRLGIGSNGQVLTVASSLPSWAASSGGGSPSLAQGRLTLQTGVPVMTTTQSAKTTIYYTPYKGRYVPIYDGSSLVMTDIGGELSQATTDSTKSPAAVANNANYDLFVWNDSGTIRCTRGPAWTSDTARGTGAGTTELAGVLGIYVNAVAITNGPAANRGTYVGTVRSNGSAQIDHIFGTTANPPTAGFFGIWNYYNRTQLSTFVADTATAWTYSGSTFRSANNSTNNRVSFISGLAEDAVHAAYGQSSVSGASGTGVVGIGLDSTSTPSGYSLPAGVSGASTVGPATAYFSGAPQIGFHFLQAIEVASNGVSQTFHWAGITADPPTGLVVRLWL